MGSITDSFRLGKIGILFLPVKKLAPNFYIVKLHSKFVS